MAREDVAHDQRLVAYIVPGGAEPPAEADLDAALRFLTRERLARALDLFKNKRESLPHKKHGNIPL